MLRGIGLGILAVATAVAKPNILFIMSDDHTSQAIGAYGGRLAPLNPTPTIDRLAREGMRFENAFCTNSICTPSRATILTGQYGHINEVHDLHGRLPPAQQYLPIEMKRLGYETAMIGKWHLKEEPAAFDYYNVLPGQGSYMNPVLYEKSEGTAAPEVEEPRGRSRFGLKQEYDGHSSDVITDVTLRWLRDRDDSKPFFLMHHFKAPHDMFTFAPRYADHLSDAFIPEPASLYYNANNGSVATRGKNDSLRHVIGSSVSHRNPNRNMGQHMKIDPDLPDPEYAHQAYQEYLKRYLRCVKGVDDNVRRLFDYLEAEGLMDETIIVYTGDQGFMLGEHDYIDKRWMYEESMRMPLLIRYPAMIAANSRIDALVNNADFAPTLIGLAGGEAPEYMQGENFAPMLKTGLEPADWRTGTYYRYWMHMAHAHANPAHFGIRTKRYKLIFFYGADYMKRFKDGNWPTDRIAFSVKRPFEFFTPPGWELYDLQTDPHEMNNLYGRAGFGEIVADLKQQLVELRSELGEDDTHYPHIQQIIDAHWDD